MKTMQQLRADWLKAEENLNLADDTVTDEAYGLLLQEANRANTEYACAFQKNHGSET